MPPINNQLNQNQTPPTASAHNVLVGSPTPTPTNVAPDPTATPEKKKKPKNPNSTQNSLLLSELRENMVIMVDGSFRAAITCKSINFDLMSSAEREGVEYSFQNFLNSLNHPIQILIRSQRIDIGPYIDKLVQMRANQDNMLLGVLMDDYINFIDDLSQEANIMEKEFYIIVPYHPSGEDGNTEEQTGNIVEQSKGLFKKLFTQNSGATVKINTATYEKAKEEIKNRVDNITAGLFQIGIQSIQLNTKRLGELYYNFYNPDTAVRQPLVNFENTTTTFVTKGRGDAPLINTGGF